MSESQGQEWTRQTFQGRTPEVGEGVYVAPGARLIGRVQIAGPSSSIWYNAVLRADGDDISVGPGTSLQDGVVVHVDPGLPVSIGRDVTVGHGAIIHGATVEDEVLIGMGATLLNGARIGTGSIVGANALVSEGKQIPPNSLVLGVPGKVVRQTTDDERAMIRRSAASYQRRTAAYLKEIGESGG